MGQTALLDIIYTVWDFDSWHDLAGCSCQHCQAWAGPYGSAEHHGVDAAHFMPTEAGHSYLQTTKYYRRLDEPVAIT